MYIYSNPSRSERPVGLAVNSSVHGIHISTALGFFCHFFF